MKSVPKRGSVGSTYELRLARIVTWTRRYRVSVLTSFRCNRSSSRNRNLKIATFPPIFCWPIEGEAERSALLRRNFDIYKLDIDFGWRRSRIVHLLPLVICPAHHEADRSLNAQRHSRGNGTRLPVDFPDLQWSAVSL